jgi:uncharacterized protein involved in type VI secretion and phage assembly
LARTFLTAFSVGDASASKVLRFREVHALGVPAFVEIDVLFDGYFDTEDLIAQTALLEFAHDGGTTRMFAGVVDSVTAIGSSAVGNAARTYQYTLRLVTEISLLAGNHGCRILQNVNVQGAVQAVLTDSASDLKVEWRLTGSYPTRD